VNQDGLTYADLDLPVRPGGASNVVHVAADVYKNAQNDPTGSPTPLPKVPGFSSKTTLITIIEICML